MTSTEASPRPRRPRVSVGVPVYNGEAHLEQALASIAAQTFQDYEVVICDNASTDRSAEICRSHAARDPRIRYHRNPENIGGDRNYNRCYELATGDYVLTLAHDDRLGPEYLEKTVGVMDASPDVVFCHTRSRQIDDADAVVADLDPNPFSDSDKPHERLFDAICVSRYVVANFGLIRMRTLRAMPPLAVYPSSDAFWQAELALRGRLHEIPEFHFYRRIRAGAGHLVPLHERLAWSDPSRAAALAFPTWRRLGEYMASIRRVPMPLSERLRCFAQLGRYWRVKRIPGQLVRDLRMNVRRLLLRSDLVRRLHERRSR